MSLPLAHLSRRFFQVITARPLGPTEQLEIANVLDEAESRLFWAQSPPDQRHGYATMMRLMTQTTEPTALRAALLHDVGKSMQPLGAIGRVLATLLDWVGVELRGRFAAYRRHGAIGAHMLIEAGSPPLVVDFARRHPDPEPGEHDPTVWSALLEADHV